MTATSRKEAKTISDEQEIVIMCQYQIYGLLYHLAVIP